MGLFITSLIANCQWGADYQNMSPETATSRDAPFKGAMPKRCTSKAASTGTRPKRSPQERASTKSTSHWRSVSPNGDPLPKDSLHRGHSQRRMRERRTTAKSAPPKRSAVIHTKSRQRLDTVSHAHPHVSAFSWKKISSCLKLISIEDHLTATKLEELEEGWVLDASCVFNRYCTCLMLFCHYQEHFWVVYDKPKLGVMTL